MPEQDEQEQGMFSGSAVTKHLHQHRPFCLQSEDTYNKFWDPKYKEYNNIKNLSMIEITGILNIKNNS